jgi:uncharacterized protein (DUF1697 family)
VNARPRCAQYLQNMSATHIALLRGINVGTAKRIAMAVLKRVVEDLGCTNVKTLLNSGNVIFTTPRTVTGATLQKAIRDATGVDSRTTVLTAAELATVMKENPLHGVATNHSLLFAYMPQTSALLPKFTAMLATDWAPEVLAVGSRAAYAWSPNGSLAGQLFGLVNKQFGDTVTARNWATLLKIQALVDS